MDSLPFFGCDKGNLEHQIFGKGVEIESKAVYILRITESESGLGGHVSNKSDSVSEFGA